MKRHLPWTSILLTVAALAPASAAPPAASAPAAATSPAPSAGSDPRAAIEGQLQRGEWSAALAAAEGEIHRLLETAAPNAASRMTAERSLPRLVAWQAVAEAGLGRTDDAVWDWQVAQNLVGGWPISWDELSSFGPPAKLLAEHPLRKPGEAPAGLEVRKSGASPGGAAGDFKPTRPTSAPPPALPAALRGRSVPKWLTAELVVDAQGRPRDPLVVASRLPEMTYAVLAAVRGWRFAPATAGGAPVASFYSLSANGAIGRPLEQLVRLDDDALRKLDEMLRAQQWQEAEKRAHTRWNRVLDDNEQAATYLAVLLTFRALADAGLGHEAQAICRWNAAQTLDPLIFHAGLKAYGAPGALLERNRWGAYPFEAERIAAGVPPKPERVENARVVHQTTPRTPSYLSQTATTGTVVITAIVDRAGVLREAEIDRSSGWHDLDASVLDNVCDWQVEPAKLDGKAVPSYYSTGVAWTAPRNVPG